jgi:hypothetical protein
VLDLSVDEDGETIAHVQHNLTLAGTVRVRTDDPSEFRPSVKPLTHQLATCWSRWQAAEAKAEAQALKKLQQDKQLRQEQQLPQQQKKPSFHQAPKAASSSAVSALEEFVGNMSMPSHNAPSQKSYSASNPA